MAHLRIYVRSSLQHKQAALRPAQISRAHACHEGKQFGLSAHEQFCLRRPGIYLRELQREITDEEMVKK